MLAYKIRFAIIYTSKRDNELEIEMIRIFTNGDNVPEYIALASGHVTPSIKFGGVVIFFKYKGVGYLKLLFGHSLIQVYGGVNFHIKFNNVVFLPAFFTAKLH